MLNVRKCPCKNKALARYEQHSNEDIKKEKPHRSEKRLWIYSQQNLCSDEPLGSDSTIKVTYSMRPLVESTVTNDDDDEKVKVKEKLLC